MIDHSSVPVVPITRKPLSFWAPIVTCEAVIVAMPPLLSSARTVKSSSSARPGTNVFSRARSRTADSPATNRTNS